MRSLRGMLFADAKKMTDDIVKPMDWDQRGGGPFPGYRLAWAGAGRRKRQGVNLPGKEV